MNDPWNVKCVKQGRQYQSCMKLNGVPLLPPLLSKECRKEMEYYKLLAQEVEKRMSALHAYIRDRDRRGYSGDDADATDPQKLPEYQKLKAIQNCSALETPGQDKDSSENNRKLDSQVVIDVNVKISEKRTTYSPDLQACDDPPERDRDYNNSNEVQQDDILSDIESSRNRLIHQLINLDIFKKASSTDQDSPSSLSVKNFTGSLNDLQFEIAKEAPIQPLIRQSSYTLLTPSPQLLAHLEIQSLNTGVDVQAISMSESTNNLSPTSKKRKSWDLESAKEKWSSMALELQKNIGTKPNDVATKTTTQKPHILKVFNRSLQENTKKVYGYNSFKKSPKSEPIQKSQNVAKKSASPVRRTIKSSASYVIDKEERKKDTTVAPPKNTTVAPPKDTTVALISESKDPAAKVRELYEKLQKQHMMQMANLIEKQKREQQLLQQVFNEQNNLLLKQLKMVCPKATIIVKEAWGEEKNDADGRPVSLSQLLHSTPINSMPNSPASKTLTDSKSCLNKCDNVLKHSRDIINSIKKGSQAPQATVNGIKNQLATTNKQALAHDSTIVTSSRSRSPSRKNASPNRRNSSPSRRNSSPNRRNASPSRKNASRRLDYDSSAATEDEPMLTDRTNDTMADLNVTFPSDNEEGTGYSNPLLAPANTLERTVSPVRSPSPIRRSANRNFEEAVNSMKNVKQSNLMCRTATTEEREAATKIVAYAKGYLVRRLMRTERVQATVQTIRDALLCALQLHQDREGIRGADVDLHRRLIQQITAACYTLHDTFVGCSTSDRCALIAADRSRKMVLASKPSSTRTRDVMSHSHSGVFPSRPRPNSAGQMTRSYYATETTSSEQHRPRYQPARRPWR